MSPHANRKCYRFVKKKTTGKNINIKIELNRKKVKKKKTIINESIKKKRSYSTTDWIQVYAFPRNVYNLYVSCNNYDDWTFLFSFCLPKIKIKEIFNFFFFFSPNFNRFYIRYSFVIKGIKSRKNKLKRCHLTELYVVIYSFEFIFHETFKMNSGW